MSTTGFGITTLVCLCVKVGSSFLHETETDVAATEEVKS